MRSLLLPLGLVFFLFSCSPDSASEDEEPNPEPSLKYYNQHKAFGTQEEVDNFAKGNFNVIVGNLSIFGESITDLSGLSTLNEVRGSINILATGLEDLDGLENLNLIEGTYVSVVNNPLLKDIKGLKGISVDLRQLEVRGSPLLENLEGLEGITNVSYQLDVMNLENLRDVHALSNINNPVEYIYLRNTGITNSEGLSNIPQVKHFLVDQNPNLTSLNLRGLKKVERLTIDRNIGLENLDGLIGLEELHELHLQYNTSLKNLDGLTNLKGPDNMGINIFSNSSLDDYCGLQHLAAAGWNQLSVLNNLYNPTPEQIAGEECRL